MKNLESALSIFERIGQIMIIVFLIYGFLVLLYTGSPANDKGLIIEWGIAIFNIKWIFYPLVLAAFYATVKIWKQE